LQKDLLLLKKESRRTFLRTHLRKQQQRGSRLFSKAIKTRHQLLQVRRRKAVAAKEAHKKDGMHSIRKLKERLGRS
jgi:hypothetical protein